MFGLTREVPLIYGIHRDLQIRTYNAIPRIVADLPRDVTSQIALGSTPDPRQEQKLDDWSDMRLTAILIPQQFPPVTDPWRVLLRTLEQRLFTRDLYAETAPSPGKERVRRPNSEPASRMLVFPLFRKPKMPGTRRELTSSKSDRRRI
jgi:hypothetical protein